MKRFLSLLLLLPALPASASPRTHIVWSTFYGSGATYLGQAVAIAPDGSIVLGGGYTGDCTHCAAHTRGFVMDLGASGRAVHWRKNIPANVNALTVDRWGNILLTGSTTEASFPTVHAFQAHAKGEAAMVAKLSPRGTILFSTYLGGELTRGAATATDPRGSIYVAGLTYSQALPTVHAVQPHWGGQPAPNAYGTDAFIAKFTASGHIVYSTYLGRKQNDEADGIAADAAGNAYISGWTASPDFPTVHPLPGTACGGASGFLAEINPSGGHLLKSTCLSYGTSAYATHLVLAPDGSIYLSDATSRHLFHLAHDHLAALGSIPKSFSVLTMAPGPQGSILLAGSIPQADGRTCGLEDGSHPCTDAAALEIGANGKTRLTVRLGGGADDEAHAVAALGNDIVLTGKTASTDFPLHNPIQARNSGIFVQYNSGPVDMFVSRISPS